MKILVAADGSTYTKRMLDYLRPMTNGWVWESSGTHGEPGYFVQDAQSTAVYDARKGLRRSSGRWSDPMLLLERIAFVGATGGHFASYASVQRLRRLNPWLARTANCFSVLQPIATFVDALNSNGGATAS